MNPNLDRLPLFQVKQAILQLRIAIANILIFLKEIFEETQVIPVR